VRGAVRPYVNAAKAVQPAVLIRDAYLICAAALAVGKSAALFRAHARTPAAADDARYQAFRASRFGQFAGDLFALATDVENAAMAHAFCLGLRVALGFAGALLAGGRAGLALG